MTRGNRWCDRMLDRWLPVSCLVVLAGLTPIASAQSPSAEVAARLETGRKALVARIDKLKRDESINRRLVADVEVFAKAIEWAVRHK